jgi:hypothetical protein
LQKKERNMSSNTSVIGIYPDPTTVSDAVDVLHKAGYRATDISVMSSDNQGSKDFAHEKHTKALQGAATGTAAGALVGAALAATMAGLAPLAEVGPVLAAFAGAGAGAAIGWIAGFVAGMRLPEYVAKRYAGRIRRGGILLSVHCDSQRWIDRAKKALKDTGAREISSAVEASADYGTTDRPTERAPAADVLREQTPAQRTAEFLARTAPK